MQKEVLGRCPVCDEELKVTKLSCPSCHTHIEGEFSMCKFCRLSNEQKYFIEIFIKSRGNIKEIEKELGISYPTVRSRLENIISSLGYQPKNYNNESDKKDILEKLKNGDITTDEAIKLLKG